MITKCKIILLLILWLLVIKSQAQVVINEVMTSPAASNPSLSNTTNANSLYNIFDLPSYNREWVELFNKNACDTADISCYTLGCNMQDDENGSANWGTFTFPSGTKIPPNGFLVIGGNDAQVPILEFNTTQYRNNSFGFQYIDGDSNRWFLRDANGWVALYNPQGVPVDAVYWDESSIASSLFNESEYFYPIITRTTCSGLDTLMAANTIPGIKFIGAPSASSNLTFQRIQDGSPIWFSLPHTPTPHSNNGQPIGPAIFQASVINEKCNLHNGSISLTIDENGTGPYSISWNTVPTTSGSVATNLSTGSYIVTLSDTIGCFNLSDTFDIVNESGPSVSITDVVNDTCTASVGSAQALVSGGTPAFNYLWNSVPSQQSSQLQNVEAGTYTVIVTDDEGCICSDSITILDHPAPSFTISSISDTCSKGRGLAEVQINGTPHSITYIWNTGSTLPYIDHIISGTYHVTVSDSVCVKTSLVIINNLPANEVDFQIDPPYAFMDDPTINFIDLSVLPRTWNWTFGDGNTSNIKNPSNTYSETGSYIVTLISEDQWGCVDSVSKSIQIKDKTHFFAPNAFTPNDDGNNDIFRIYGLNINNFNILIFNRFGEVIFESSNTEVGWDGTFKGEKCSSGVYVWKATFDDEQDVHSNKKRVEYGKIVLIR